MDWKRYLADAKGVNPVALHALDHTKCVAEACLGSLHWEDVLVDATIFTPLKDTGRGVIEINLGYLPPDTVTLPFEPYLRALIQSYWQGTLTEDDFLHQLEDHLKLIRNADMKHNVCETYNESIYQNYRETFLPNGQAVRERLTAFLGYEPQLEHSLIAELWLRDVLTDDLYRSKKTPEEARALTLIKYREVLLAEGQRAADVSPLIG